MLQGSILINEIMKDKFKLSFLLLLVFSLAACAQSPSQENLTNVQQASNKPVEKIVKTESEWKKILTPEQFHVLREQGTELAFTGNYWSNKENGVYVCAACDLELFSSDSKFKSASGWPSFYQPVIENHVGTETDRTFGMERTEVHCARCGGHLGHIFNDGPKPTGLRYCINSVSLNFKPQ